MKILASVLSLESMDVHSRDVDMMEMGFGSVACVVVVGSVACVAVVGTLERTCVGLTETGLGYHVVLWGYHKLDCLLEPVAVVLDAADRVAA